MSNHDLIVGMKRARGCIDASEGDVDFALFLIQKEIDALQASDDEETNQENADVD